MFLWSGTWSSNRWGERLLLYITSISVLFHFLSCAGLIWIKKRMPRTCLILTSAPGSSSCCWGSAQGPTVYCQNNLGPRVCLAISPCLPDSQIPRTSSTNPFLDFPTSDPLPRFPPITGFTGASHACPHCPPAYTAMASPQVFAILCPCLKITYCYLFFAVLVPPIVYYVILYTFLKIIYKS